ncbi:PD-(D/E)XK nuclease family protein [bacterium]|nr:MAG: PD-(D/E)XK nuclease family protein [bacterium]
MVSFLSELAKDIYSRHRDDLGEICIVFQNRRACLYFKHFLAEEFQQAVWAPKVLTIEDFILELNPVQIIEPVLLLFEFFTVYRKTGGSDSFDHFAQWGEILLKDFDEIDAYLVPTDKLFHHLNEAKAIEQWDPDGKALTDFQLQYLRFWESFEPLYEGLRKHLIQRHLAYKGMALREVAENIESKIAQKTWKKIIFAGFNALSLSEEKIFKSLIKMKRADVIWDMDAYYVRNDKQEAGHYVRKYLREWKISSPKWEKNFLLSERKKIQIIGAAKHVGQAKVAGDLLEKIHNADAEINNTAVILADESLLFPMLHSIPESIKNINVSMGLSLKFTPLYSLIESLFDLQDNAREFKDIDGNVVSKFYHKDVISVLGHPLLQERDERKNTNANRRLIRHIISENILFISSSEIETFFMETDSSYKNIFFVKWNHSRNALNSMLDIALWLREIATVEKTAQWDIELEPFFRFFSTIRLLQSLLESHETPLELKSLRLLLTEILASERIPFSGEPLKGLQVMGMLETRTLDFENVIMLSVNENILPAAKNQQSMIPFDIKIAYHLPAHKEKDAIFAYNFYRSIQRAKNIYLIYNSETDDFGNGERSRFITQLIFEMPKFNANMQSGDITESFLAGGTFSAHAVADAEIKIFKNERVVRQIDHLIEKGLSPTALNTYINCPLKFYLKYIVRLTEADETEETIEAGTFGSAMHFTLENLYRPFEEKIITSKDVDGMAAKAQPLLIQAFQQFLKNGDIQHGKNHLMLKVGIKLIKNFLKLEARRIADIEQSGKTVHVLALEKEVSCDLNFQLNDQKKIVRLKGKMDRIDGVESNLFIIDYKTGRVDNKELNVGALSELISDPGLAKSFQLIMYGYIYVRSGVLSDPQMISAVYPFKKLTNGLQPVSVNGTSALDGKLFSEFEEVLKKLLIQVTDPQTAFLQTEDVTRCRNCEYISLCRRN